MSGSLGYVLFSEEYHSISEFSCGLCDGGVAPQIAGRDVARGRDVESGRVAEPVPVRYDEEHARRAHVVRSGGEHVPPAGGA